MAFCVINDAKRLEHALDRVGFVGQFFERFVDFFLRIGVDFKTLHDLVGAAFAFARETKNDSTRDAVRAVARHA